MSRIVGIIPARMASSRLPDKPMLKIDGIPMIGHVYLRSRMCNSLKGLYVATCDREIADYITSIGGEAIMTSTSHKRASDRTAEALLKIERKTKKRADVVVMIQGDEPMVFPGMIRESVKALLKDKKIQVANLMAPLKLRQEHENPNIVKVVSDKDGFALYFSREPIPSRKKATGAIRVYKQVPIIPFRRDFLIRFNALAPTPLEIAESVDMLRVQEHGYKVKMVSTRFKTYGVDTIDDLRKVRRLMRTDPLIGKYKA